MFNYLENGANIVLSQEFAEIPESAICGENSRDNASEMVTQSLLQSKALTNPNIKHASESPDSLALCVGGIERKKQRIGVRLTITERQALEFAAKQNNMTLSNLISQVAQIFAQQKSA